MALYTEIVAGKVDFTYHNLDNRFRFKIIMTGSSPAGSSPGSSWGSSSGRVVLKRPTAILDVMIKNSYSDDHILERKFQL